MQTITRREKLYGWAAGHLLARAGVLAHRRGDNHLFDHIRAAVNAGNSGRCRPGFCVLHRSRGRVF